MAYLKVIAGNCPDQVFPLHSERMVLGRHPSCEIVIDNAAVSRYHARILENHGSFLLEDLRSRNQTYLNGVPVEGRAKLNDGDTITVCNAVFHFHLQTPTVESLTRAVSSPAFSGGNKDFMLGVQEPVGTSDSDVPDAPEGVEDFGLDSSSVVGKLNARSGSEARLGVKPEAKLQAVLEIGQALASELNLDEVLRKTLDCLFDIYPQADEGVVLLKDRNRDKLHLKVTKFRREGASGPVRVSMTIVNQVMTTGDAILSADASGDHRFQTSDSLTRLRLTSVMCVPLLDKAGEALGVMQLVAEQGQRQFSQDDLDVLCSIASQVGLAVENARLHEYMLRQRDLQRDLDLAMQIQLGFLPNERPTLPGYEFCDYYEAALHVGGDYFDYIMLPENRIALTLGDVAGKGIPAALLMARLYSSARLHLLTMPSLSEAMSALNAEVMSSGLGNRFITMVMAIIDANTHEVSIVNAGHLPPVLRSPGGQVRELALDDSGMPLGVAAEQHFVETAFPLSRGDTLTLYTDGITESMRPGGELYGRSRLSDCLAAGPGDVRELIEAVVESIEQFSLGQTQRDDMCLVCVQRRS